jgi:CubicO group peptidase (beta-lactamase class C family)
LGTEKREVDGESLNSAALLPDATGGQEQRFAAAFSLVNDAILRRSFPGAVLAVAYRGELVAHREFGRFTYEAEADSPLVTRETLWDLASLTKVICTTSMAMMLHERGKLDLDARVVELLPEFDDGLDRRREAVTVRMLLAHSSGLPAHRRFYCDLAGREAITAAAMRVPLETAPMERMEYSDIGFMLLGEILQRIARERLEEFCRREVFVPLKLNVKFGSHLSVIAGVPPTENDTSYRNRVIRGEVHDQNTFAMGGIAPHAGLFGDALSVARFAECLVSGEHPLFRTETVRLFTTREAGPEGTSRALGWDTPSGTSQSGTKFSKRSFGHTGFTGTSVWCDAERRLSVTMLTNRTWPDALDNSIKQVRPKIHDAIVDALENR